MLVYDQTNVDSHKLLSIKPFPVDNSIRCKEEDIEDTVKHMKIIEKPESRVEIAERKSQLQTSLASTNAL